LNNPRYAGAYAYGRRPIDEPSTVKRPCSGVTTMTGWLVSRMPIPATSPGNNSRRISGYSGPTVEDMKWRAHRLLGKVQHCCKDGRCAGDAVRTASAVRPGSSVGIMAEGSSLFATHHFTDAAANSTD
jgi:hypothetical protein